jgi:type IX secretion system PorP/SprF family membrane protein
MRKIGIIFLLIINVLITSAQDIHFSQFNAAPLNLNPANTGLFDGDYRFILNHRNQWSAVTLPFNTYSASFDMVLPTDQWKIKHLPTGIWGAGIVFNTDKSGDGQLNLIEAKVSLSYTQKIKKDSTMFLTFAIQPGISSKSINYNNLQFDQQWNGDAFDPNLPSGEAFQRNSITYSDFNMGIRWHYKLKQRNSITAGLSYDHFGTPMETFLTNFNSQLSPKIAFHANGQFMASDNIDLLPSWLYEKQNTFSEAIIGMNAKYIIDPEENTNFYLGLFVRFDDAFIPMVSMDYANFTLGISYDINTSGLKPASNSQGGLEISLCYIIKTFKPLKPGKKICPVYL